MTHGVDTVHEVRLISIYATRWRSVWPQSDQQASLDDQAPHLDLGALEEFYSLFRDQLPRILLWRQHDPATVTFKTSGQGDSSHADWPIITRAESWLFALPSDQVVAAIDIDFQSPPLDSAAAPTINVLGHGAYARFQIDEHDLESHITELAMEVDATRLDSDTFLPPERHQIVFASHTAGGKVPDEETIALILYRSDPPYRPEFMKVRRPSGLNTGSCVCAVTPYVSLLYGHPEYVENSVFLTAVQAVGTSARFRQIWHRAHWRVRDFRYNGQEAGVGRQPKSAMEFLSDELGNLELELSFSVEASADLGLLIPLLRIESFHKELYAAMELRERAETVSRMFTRLDASIRSELTAIEIREQQESEAKRIRRSAAISVLSLVGVPLGFLLTFFGINAQQVNEDWSMFNWDHYSNAYVAAFCLALSPLVTFLALNGRAWLRNRREKRLRHQRVLAEQKRAALKPTATRVTDDHTAPPELLTTDHTGQPQVSAGNAKVHRWWSKHELEQPVGRWQRTRIQRRGDRVSSHVRKN